MRSESLRTESQSADDVRVGGPTQALQEKGKSQKKTEKLHFQSQWILVGRKAERLVLVGEKDCSAESETRAQPQLACSTVRVTVASINTISPQQAVIARGTGM
jgi:hypothetical protein